MKTYAVFATQRRVREPGGTETRVLIEPAAGDRAVILLDGRLRRDRQLWIAELECRKRGFTHFRLLRGQGLLDARPISDWKEA